MGKKELPIDPMQVVGIVAMTLLYFAGAYFFTQHWQLFLLLLSVVAMNLLAAFLFPGSALRLRKSRGGEFAERELRLPPSARLQRLRLMPWGGAVLGSLLGIAQKGAL